MFPGYIIRREHRRTHVMYTESIILRCLSQFGDYV